MYKRQGVTYTAVGAWSTPVSELPRFWLGWIARPRAPREHRHIPATVGQLDAVARARAYLRAIPTPVVGLGSDTATFSAAARLVKGFKLDPATAVSLMMLWAPSFDRLWIERKVASAERYATEPAGGLLEARR